MHRIVTISREFGSGGRELGKRLADELGCAYYDGEIATAVAEKSGLAEQYVQSISERQFNVYPIHYGRTFEFFAAPDSNYTKMLMAQQEFLVELAERGDCVIVGRGADKIRERYQPLSIFVYADMESKIRRCREKAPEGENLTDKELKKKIQQVDSGRAQYRRLFSDNKWGAKEDHQLCINTSRMNIKELIPSVAAYARCWFASRDMRKE